MEKSKQIQSEISNSPDEVLPVIIDCKSTNGVDGFDGIKELEDGDLQRQHSSTSFQFLNHSTEVS